jgi:hypothetical protein
MYGLDDFHVCRGSREGSMPSIVATTTVVIGSQKCMRVGAWLPIFFSKPKDKT